MPVDIGKKQSIEEITNGRIRKTEREEPRASAGGRQRISERPMTGRKAGRGK